MKFYGLRYVPLFLGVWDNTNSYDALCVVENNLNSYTSKQFVPSGIDINNVDYWALTGNYNAQVQFYNDKVDDLINGNIPLGLSGDSEKLGGFLPSYFASASSLSNITASDSAKLDGLSSSAYAKITDLTTLNTTLLGKSDLATKHDVNLLAVNWVGSDYTLSITGITLTSIQDITPIVTITALQVEALQLANIIATGQVDGSITLTCFGTVPTIDIPLTVIIRGSM